MVTGERIGYTVGLILFLGCVFLFFGYTQAQVKCPNPGEVPITDANREQARAAGIPVDKSKCWKPSDPHVGMNAAQAKQYLKSLPRRGLSNCAPATDDANIERLNDTFAICAAQFFKAYIARYGSVTITSAYRDGPSGANRCAGGVPGSNHTRGVAMDVHGNYQAMYDFARSNPQFGVCFPRPMYNGKPDLPHMILAGLKGSREAARCAAQGVTKPCSGAPPTNITYPPPSSDTTAGPPSQQYSQALRELFKPPQQQQPSAQQPQQPQQPQQQIPQIPPGYCIKSLNPLEIIPCPQLPPQQQPASALPNQQGLTDAFGQPISPTGQPGTSPDLVSQRLLTPTSTTPAKEEKKSALEQINDWMFGGEEVETADVGTPVELMITEEDAVGLTAEVEPSATQPSQPTSTPQTGGVYAEQTFTSPDLASVGQDEKAELAGYQAFLQNMKETLTTMLAYLKPFGRPTPEGGYYE